MTQAILKSSFTASSTSQSSASSQTATGSIRVNVGDFIFAVGRVGNNSNRTWSDNLGNTWSNIDANGLRAYSRITNAGTLTTVTQSFASNNTGHAMMIAAIFDGPFDTSPLDVNPAGINDISAPYTCPASGTLAKNTELVIGLYIYGWPDPNKTHLATPPFTKIAQVQTGATVATIGAVMSYWKSNKSDSITPEFTVASFPANGTAYTNSFKFTPLRRRSVFMRY